MDFYLSKCIWYGWNGFLLYLYVVNIPDLLISHLAYLLGGWVAYLVGGWVAYLVGVSLADGMVRQCGSLATKAATQNQKHLIALLIDCLCISVIL